MVVGVNGAGKTTTIGKLAAQFMAQKKPTLVAAGDTFRAAATEQLDIWAQRAGVPLVRGAEGSDPGAVVFDTLEKAHAGSPHEVLLVVDATNGQNAIAQARQFHEALHVTGFVLTKLDGTAKGGVIIGICDELKIPVRYVGVGEAIEDLRTFSPREFVEALFA